MTRDQAIAKIKKCLSLARSANEHEAAAALRQAQALMREHQVTEADAQLSDVGEQHSRPRPSAINKWELMLAQCIDEAFCVEHFHNHRHQLLHLELKRWREVVFIGVGTAAEVAAYAFDVLVRQCTAARLDHVRRQSKNCKPATRTARGDVFALGWVLSVRKLIQRFAGRPEDQLLIERYKAAKYPDLTTSKPRDRTVGRNVRDADLDAGIAAGRSANLHHGVAGQARALLGG